MSSWWARNQFRNAGFKWKKAQLNWLNISWVCYNQLEGGIFFSLFLRGWAKSENGHSGLNLLHVLVMQLKSQVWEAVLCKVARSVPLLVSLRTLRVYLTWLLLLKSPNQWAHFPFHCLIAMRSSTRKCTHLHLKLGSSSSGQWTFFSKTFW